MIGSLQARIIGILRNQFEKSPSSFLTIKEILGKYQKQYHSQKIPNYNTIATILRRLADNGKVESYEEYNRLFYRYIDIEKEVTNSLLKIFLQAFGVSGLTHLTNKTKNLTEIDIKKLMSETEY